MIPTVGKTLKKKSEAPFRSPALFFHFPDCLISSSMNSLWCG